ncbi:MAG: MBL fold metallo-hydrolase [Myxococcota bacterium]
MPSATRWEALVGAGLALTGCFGAAGHRGPVTDHFDGDVFLNQEPPGQKGVGEVLSWLISREPGPWPDWVDAPPGPPPPPRVRPGDLRVTFIGHATTLIQLDGLNVLTDPVYSYQPTPVNGLGPTRVRPPGIRFRDLPRIDAVVISHNHYDHLDLPTLRWLRRVHDPSFFVGLGNAAVLRDGGIERVEEHDWWGRSRVGALEVICVPAHHFSRRGAFDGNNTLWAGWVLRSSRAGSVYFAGDTGMGVHFEQIRAQLGSPRLAILPIGAYLPRWFMSPVHIDPSQAVEAHRILGAKQSVGIHYDTFPLADEAYGQAPRDLRRALVDQGIDPASFWTLEFGEGRYVGR